jgi:hypothetical protein
MIVATGFLLVYQEFALAAIAIGGFVLTNVAAWGMWKRSNRLDPFRALMAVLGLMAVTRPLVWFTVSAWASAEALAKMNWPSSGFWNAAIPLLVPACMAWFWLLEHGARSADCESRTTS